MMGTKKQIAALVAAALTASAALPATAAPASKPAQMSQVQAAGSNDATDFSARRYRRGSNAAGLAMFGAVAGTIATIAINEQRRKRERDYLRYRYGYYGHPGYAYAPQAYYGYGGHRYGNPYAYGTPYHGPYGPWRPPCSRGFC
jgi:hypothetical protein